MEVSNINGAYNMQLKPVSGLRQIIVDNSPNIGNTPIASATTSLTKSVIPTPVRKPFIEANTNQVELLHLSDDCIIPVFSKDNEKTIAHQEFIEAVQEAAYKAFPDAKFQTPEIRVSHQIKGRTPEAIHKPVKELLDNEKTIYYERMAFIMKSTTIIEKVGGNELQLTIGGVRAYNQENLYSRKSAEKFKFFVGFQNQVCCNLCVSTDGFLEGMRVMHVRDLESKALEVLHNYRAELHLNQMQKFTNYSLSEHQFAQLVGKARLYQHLPKKFKSEIPQLDFNDGQFSTIAKDYYQDESFCRDDVGNIDLWKVYNLFTQANKSSYIDTFLERNVNAFDFNQGIVKALSGSNSDYAWFLS
ncbi:DUF3871 family protein [Flavobacterium alkalisoli]|uniref:DUF3871 family protein n=1 Tax=Flavobacterium alkalisoli TaxID=2602769 RepID=A0A5B9FQ61_9FLAO|nr:DUF3871 family protein [Flavobacterium alkalisoli]QEE49110.1 DUF3871 family protein [Flavobacterium alkalisoli]